MRGLRRCTLLFLACLVVVGCADEESEESELSEEDAGTIMTLDASSDASSAGKQDGAPPAPLDAAEPVSELDASSEDASDTLDAGSDAGSLDAGLDAGNDAGQDAGASDAGGDAGKDAGADAGKDSGLPDASQPDASQPDASVADASVPDASVAAGTFSSVYQILSANCSGCHGNSGGLSMGSKQRAYDELTGGPMGPALGAAEGPQCSGAGRRRVIPGNAANSLIIQKLSGVPPCGSEMPPGDSLSPAAIAEIAAWITAGALDN